MASPFCAAMFCVVNIGLLVFAFQWPMWYVVVEEQSNGGVITQVTSKLGQQQYVCVCLCICVEVVSECE